MLGEPECVEVVKSASHLLHLQAKPQLSGEESSSIKLVSQESACIPSVCFDSQSTKKYRGRESTVVYDNNYYLAAPKLVQRNLAPLNEKPNHSSMKRRLGIFHTKP